MPPDSGRGSLPDPNRRPAAGDRPVAGGDPEQVRTDRDPAAGFVNLDIGPAAWGELPKVARLQRRAFRPALAYRMPTLVMLRLLPGARFLVARRRGRVVGCAIGDRELGRARVVNLAVDPAAQGQGIGRALLAALEDALPGGDVLLMVEIDNLPARALYARAGYVDDGRAANYYGPGRPGIWMRKRRGLTADAPSRLRV